LQFPQWHKLVLASSLDFNDSLYLRFLQKQDPVNWTVVLLALLEEPGLGLEDAIRAGEKGRKEDGFWIRGFVELSFRCCPQVELGDDVRCWCRGSTVVRGKS
jgi:hypothetical protein